MRTSRVAPREKSDSVTPLLRCCAFALTLLLASCGGESGDGWETPGAYGDATTTEDGDLVLDGVVDVTDSDLGPQDATDILDALDTLDGAEVTVGDVDGTPDATKDVSLEVETETTSPEPWVYPLDDSLRLNHVQALGTHNSYHIQPQAPLHPSHKYTMPSLTDQLEIHGVRQFEWDLHWHTDGHLEVFHIAIIDQLSTCTLFSACLEETRAWSKDHPDHFPIVVWIELKDDIDIEGLGDYGSLEWHYEDVENDILEVFELSDVLTPDEVRGEHATLPEALTTTGWPTLGALRGRILFVFLEDGHHRDNYLEGSPALEGKLIFVDSDTGQEPFASFFKINNAKNDFEEVQARVSEGFIVTSNVDDPDGSDSGNAEKLEASLASGTHFLSSNFPEVTDDGAYYGDIPGGAPVRCNPVSAPADCTSEALENLTPETL